METMVLPSQSDSEYETLQQDQRPQSTRAPAMMTTLEGPRPSNVVLYLLLLLGVTTCSSAGIVFSQLTYMGVPPALAASWRLWCQSFALLGPFLRSLWKTYVVSAVEDGRRTIDIPSVEDTHVTVTRNNQPKSFLFKYVFSIPLMVLSGFFFGLHFFSWVYSIKHTSLAHSLLWVSMGPIVLNWGQWTLYSFSHLALQLIAVMRKRRRKHEGVQAADYDSVGHSSNCGSIMVQRPSLFETCGAAVGLLGAMIMLLDVNHHRTSTARDVQNTNDHEGGGGITVSKDHPPTLEGNLSAFVGAVAVSAYFVIGQNLRRWMAVWLYSFPVVTSAAVTCVVFAFLEPDTSVSFSWTERRINPMTSVFGFLVGNGGGNDDGNTANRHFLWMALYLGLGPGVCGHTLLSGLLKFLSPLTVSTAMLLEPLFGSVMGYFFGMQSIPGGWTWLGGLVLLFGLLLVILSEQQDAERQVKDKMQKIVDAFFMCQRCEIPKASGKSDTDVSAPFELKNASCNPNSAAQYGTMQIHQQTLDVG